MKVLLARAVFIVLFTVPMAQGLLAQTPTATPHLKLNRRKSSKPLFIPRSWVRIGGSLFICPETILRMRRKNTPSCMSLTEPHKTTTRLTN